jgi:archaellum component FlaC
MKTNLIIGLIIALTAGLASAQQEQYQPADKDTYPAAIRNIQRDLKDLKGTDDGLRKAISDIDNKVSKLQKQLVESNSAIQKRVEQTSQKVSELQNQMRLIQQHIDDQDRAIQKQVSDVSQNTAEAQSRIADLVQRFGQRTVQLSIGAILAGILGIAGLLLALTVRKKHAEGSAAVENRIAQMREQLDQETVKLDEKLVPLLQNQMKIMQTERERPVTSPPPQQDGALLPVDHTLPIKVGEEIFRMRQRLNALPAETKGLKPLQKSLERLEEEFNQQGYELVNMLGLKYNEGMRVKAKFIASDELEIGQAIITKVIKPQINFRDKAIQVAEIEVSTGG